MNQAEWHERHKFQRTGAISPSHEEVTKYYTDSHIDTLKQDKINTVINVISKILIFVGLVVILILGTIMSAHADNAMTYCNQMGRTQVCNTYHQDPARNSTQYCNPMGNSTVCNTYNNQGQDND